MKGKESKKGSKKVKKSVGVNITIIILIIIVVIFVACFIKKRSNDKEIAENGGGVSDNATESYVKEVGNGVKLNTSSKLNEAKEVDGLTITNIQLTTKNGMTTLLGNVTNNTEKKTDLKMVEITLLDRENNELVTVTGIIDALDKGESTQLNIAMTSDYVNAYDFVVKSK